MSDQASTVIGARYELHRRLAKGGMAMVYLGRDRALDRPVAVKILLKEFAGDPKFVERFELEAKRAAKLGHPNVVGVFDWGRDGETHYIVMEFVDGKSLSQMLRDGGPIGADRAAEITHEVAAGLGFAHENGTIHRDCKTGNIMVSHEGQVKVGDFGIATALSVGSAANLTQTGAVMGTATYFSPEQAQGKKLDQRSDLYSLGVVLYEMLSGSPPFKAEGPVAIAMKHVSEPPRPLQELKPDIPPALAAIAMKLLSKNPDDRYPTGADLQADLTRFREGGHTLASQSPRGAGADGGVTVPIADPRGPASAQSESAQPAVPAEAGNQIRIPASATHPPGYQAAAPHPEPAAQAGGGAGFEYEDEYDDEPRRPPWGYVAAVVLLLGVLVALVILLLNTLSDDGGEDANPDQSTDSAVTSDDSVETPLMEEIPSLTGMNKDDAIALLEDLGFVLGPITASERDDLPEDQVVGQIPASGNGASRERGTSIALTIAVAPPEPDDIAVPEVVGFTEAEATEALEDLDFVVVVTGVDSDDPVGSVVRQDPEFGRDAAPGSEVEIEVSTGPGLAEIPNLTSMTLEEARTALDNAGFVAVFLDGSSAIVPVGQVLSVDPSSGTQAERGTDVVVRISTGPATVVVPNVVGQLPDAAVARLELENLAVFPEGCPITQEGQVVGTVISQSPSGGADALEGDTVSFCVGEEPATDGDDGGADDGGTDDDDPGTDDGEPDPTPTPTPESLGDDL